jgi:rRNA biogenesis protein RRP5
VQALVTTVFTTGLTLQVLGYFEGTIDSFHLPPGKPEDRYKVGQKVKARILYDITTTSPPKFALSLAEHIVKLDVKRNEDATIQDSYPIGAILDTVKVIGVETERGLTVEIRPGVTGFVHVRTILFLKMPCLNCLLDLTNI